MSAEAEEGVTKYHCEWTRVPLPQEIGERADVSAMLKARDALHQLKLIHVYPDGVGFGNVSVRVLGESFLITGTQTSHVERLGLEECCLVENYSLQDNAVCCTGPVQASSESLTHAALYACSSVVKAVVHVHDGGMWRFYQGRLPTTRAEVAYGTVAMAEEMARLWATDALRAERALVMAGHEDGVISWGPSVEEAQVRMLELVQGFGRDGAGPL